VSAKGGPAPAPAAVSERAAPAPRPSTAGNGGGPKTASADFVGGRRTDRAGKKRKKDRTGKERIGVRLCFVLSLAAVASCAAGASGPTVRGSGGGPALGSGGGLGSGGHAASGGAPGSGSGGVGTAGTGGGVGTGGAAATAGTGGSGGTGGAVATGGATGSGTGGAAATGGAPGSGGTGGAAPASAWKNVVVGGGGFVAGIVFHPTQAGLLYVRTDVGGAYRFNAATSAWVPLNDSLGRTDGDLMGILSVALDRGDPNRVYLMAGKYTQSWAGTGAVFISPDQGATWTRSNLTIKVGGNEAGRGTGERLQVDPNAGSRLLMGTTVDGLWQSANAGVSFTRVTSFSPTNVNLVLYDRASGAAGSATSRIFVAASDNTQSLWRSTDGGATWAAVPGQPTGVQVNRAALSGANLYLAYADAAGPYGATKGAVWRLDTGSGVWTDLSPSTGSYGFGGISVDAQNPLHLVASTLDDYAPADEVYQSTDGGASWKPLLAGATWDRTLSPYTVDSTPHWVNDVEIDPFDSNRALFVTGYGVWMSTNLSSSPSSSSSSSSPPTWAFADAGLEETVPLQLISPPSGAPLLSAMGDIDGFKHDELDVSPPAGRYKPLEGTTLGLAFAENLPTKLVKVHNASPYGSLSTDGGATWKVFASFPGGATAGGTRTIAISADGKTIVWSPTGGAMSYSTDDGGSWTACAGNVPAGLSPIADRVNADKVYAADALNGRVFVSTNGGTAFTVGAIGLPALPSYSLGDGELAAVFGQEGHLWLTLGDGGLYRSTNSGAAFTKVGAVTSAYNVGFGKAAPGQTYPAVFIWGAVAGATGIFRSDDQGATWARLNDDQHQFGTFHSVIGDPRTYGRVYVATEARGILYRQ
jgi:hypothetical protein